jgi:hypothetical protein
MTTATTIFHDPSGDCVVCLDGNYEVLAPFLLVLSILTPSVIPLNAQSVSRSKKFSGADRTITWRPWQQNPKDEFRFRTGDRYLGRAVWEHYLGFEQFRTSTKAIKLSMIRLGNEHVREEVVIRPGCRYAILKITNHTMTARKGVWSWTAQEVQLESSRREDSRISAGDTSAFRKTVDSTPR